MTTAELLVHGWHWKPEVLAGCIALAGAYLVATGFRPGRGLLFWTSGSLVLLVSLVSPIDTLSHHYLFSAHMLQHLLLVLVVPPLLLLGLPGQTMHRLLRRPLLARIERMLRQPVVGWGLATGAMWVWHLPSLYGAALASDGVHVLQHLVFLVTATIFWWPLLAPLPDRRFAAPVAVVYLFAAMAAASVLGIVLTFAAPGLYPAYLSPEDEHGILPLIRDGWGLMPAVDQQAGGLLMWVPSNAIYLWALIATLVRWFNAPEDTAAGASRPVEVHEAPLLANQGRK